MGIKLAEVLIMTVSNYPGVSCYVLLFICYIFLSLSKYAFGQLEQFLCTYYLLTAHLSGMAALIRGLMDDAMDSLLDLSGTVRSRYGLDASKTNPSVGTSLDFS